MSKRLDVLAAVRAMVESALPGAEFFGPTDDVPDASRIAAGGRVAIGSGDPGDPEVTLGVLTYSWSHRIPIELSALPDGDTSAEAVLDAMATAIGTAIEADRTLGGLVEWLDAEPLTTDQIGLDAGGETARAGDLAVIADYSTSGPLN